MLVEAWKLLLANIAVSDPEGQTPLQYLEAPRPPTPPIYPKR